MKLAVIGLALRVPGAENEEQFWDNLVNGIESVDTFPEEEIELDLRHRKLIKDQNFVRKGAILKDIDKFDSSLFGYSPREAQLIDPQQRLFLQAAWEALENAGYDPNKYKGAIGLYAGLGINTYLCLNVLPHIDFSDFAMLQALITANDKDYLCSRVAYKLNLKGPVVVVQTACSTSLVAVHLACQSLLNGECDMALAGGVSVRVPQRSGYLYQEGGILSPDGHCRPFDARARGTVPSNGLGLVVLKRFEDALADRDSIRGVILGTAINNDGSQKSGFMAPSVDAQAAVIAEALAVAKVSPESIGFIEAHGTGTKLGDPIEIKALSRVFGGPSLRGRAVAVGSVKSNLGHLDAASGVVGLIKTILCLENRQLPPTLHFQEPNPRIELSETPFYINSTLQPWVPSPSPRRAGVSSFGIGGTNAHVVLEEAPKLQRARKSSRSNILVFSAHSQPALERVTDKMLSYLNEHQELELPDVAYTLQVGRQGLRYRRVLLCGKRAFNLSKLKQRDPQWVFDNFCQNSPHRVSFLFPGVAKQFLSAAAEWHQMVPVFRKAFNNCARMFDRHIGCDLSKLLLRNSRMTQHATKMDAAIRFNLPTTFSLEFALAQTMMEWGVEPDAMLGYSVGEYVAACIAGVLSLRAAAAIIATQARLLQLLPPWSTVVVPCNSKDLVCWLTDRLSLVSIESPRQCVVCGPTQQINVFEKKFKQAGFTCKRVRWSGPLHSSHVETILPSFRAEIKKWKLREPQIPYISNVTGTWVIAKHVMDPDYWCNHLRKTVLLADGIRTLIKESGSEILILGPGTSASQLVRDCAGEGLNGASVSVMHEPGRSLTHEQTRWDAIGRLWLHGVPLNWNAIHRGKQLRRLKLPTYAFDSQSHWISPPSPEAGSPLVREPLTPATVSAPRNAVKYVPARNITESYLVQIWEAVLGCQPVGIFDDFFELGGDSLRALQIANKIRERLPRNLPLQDLARTSTIAELAAVIDNHGKVALEASPSSVGLAAVVGSSPVVALSSGKSELPFFCMHPAGGTVLCYMPLARSLGTNHSFLGIQSPSVYGGNEPQTIEEKATYYLEVIRNAEPRGPYLLGGYSYGGNLAFEIACQLHQSNNNVKALILIDSYPPDVYESLPPPENFRHVYPRIVADYFNLDLGEIDNLREDDRLKFVIDRLNSLYSDITPEKFDHLFRLWVDHHYALQAYRPQKVYSGRITYLCCEQRTNQGLIRASRNNLSYDALVHSWSRFSSVPLDIHTIPGDHFSTLRSPSVHRVAEIIRGVLFASDSTLTREPL